MLSDQDVFSVYRGQKVVRSAIVHAAKSLGTALLSAPTQQGARILIDADNPVSMLTGIFTCWNHGFVAVPKRKDTIFENNYLEHLTTASATLRFDNDNPLIATCDFHNKTYLASNQLHAMSGDIILATSGTSGPPKGVATSASAMILNAQLAGQALKLHNYDGLAVNIDVSFTSVICHILMAWQYNIPLFYLEGMTLEERDEVFRKGKIAYGGSPLSSMRLIDEQAGLATPSMIVTSGDFLRRAIFEKIKSHNEDIDINSFYGLTEFSGRLCHASNEDLQAEEMTGRPLPGFMMRLAKDGETIHARNEAGDVLVRSSLLMQGYIHPSKGFEAVRYNHEFHTGDQGLWLENGALRLVGRHADVFKVAGEQVNRKDIEKCLAPLLSDWDFGVVAIAHDILGFVPALLISKSHAKPDVEIPSMKEIFQVVKESLPSRCVPMSIKHTDDPIPRTDSGKLIISACQKLLSI